MAGGGTRYKYGVAKVYAVGLYVDEASVAGALKAYADVDGKAVLTPWTETDFRTDTPPWWK